MIPTSNTSSSTPPSCARTSTRRAQKGGSGSGDRRSRGGLSTKFHISVDALGNPLRVRLTPGHTHVMTEAKALIEGLPAEIVIAEIVIADSTFDAGAFRDHLAGRSIAAVIAANPTNASCPALYRHLYKERHLVECFINKIKRFCRIATRYDKTTRAYFSMICIACMMLWLK